MFPAPLTVALEHRAPCYFLHQVTKIANHPAKLATYIYNIYVYLRYKDIYICEMSTYVYLFI